MNELTFTRVPARVGNTKSPRAVHEPSFVGLSVLLKFRKSSVYWVKQPLFFAMIESFFMVLCDINIMLAA